MSRALGEVRSGRARRTSRAPGRWFSVFGAPWSVNVGSWSALLVCPTPSQFDEARDLVADAIRAGIFNDLGSGSNVDLTAILLDGSVKVMRNFDKPNPKPPLNLDYSYKRGTTGTPRMEREHPRAQDEGPSLTHVSLGPFELHAHIQLC